MKTGGRKNARPLSVLVLNGDACGDWLEQRTAALPIRIRHAAYRLPWERIAERRAGVVTKSDPVPADLQRAFADADVIFGFFLPLDIVSMAPGLRWVETPAAGYDQLNGTGVLESDALLTTVGSVYASAVAEHVFALLLAQWRRMDEFRDCQRRGEWRVGEVRELEGATMAIVGLGNIGQAVARVAKAFGMRVLGTRRRFEEKPPFVDQMFAPHDLRAMLALADVVVLAVSGTPQTTCMIGAAEIAALQPGACLINVARGVVVDEEALCQALLARRLGGACLDVFVDEPLPKESSLWQLPNVLITPHVAVNVPSKLRRAVEHFAENLERYLAGKPLLDAVAERAVVRGGR